MSKIRSKDTLPEVLLRKSLFKEGLRYRIHYKLPGKPDIVFVSKRLAVFINGCFWHGHDCKIDNKPDTNAQYWANKIKNNKNRDSLNYLNLEQMGWKYYVSWECLILNNIRDEVNNIKKILISI